MIVNPKFVFFTFRIQVTCFQSVPSGSDYGRVEVPMHIVPSPKISSACLQSLARLPGILTMEEEEAYQRYAKNCSTCI